MSLFSFLLETEIFSLYFQVGDIDFNDIFNFIRERGISFTSRDVDEGLINQDLMLYYSFDIISNKIRDVKEIWEDDRHMIVKGPIDY